MTFPYDLDVEEWEDPACRVRDFTNSPPLDWSAINNVTIHYPGTSSSIESEDATREGLAESCRRSQSDYVASRGYSYGYSCVVWGSLAAEVRGEAFRAASNGGTSTNVDSFTIQIRAGGTGPNARAASPAEIDRVRSLVAWAESRAGRRLDITGHQEHKPTACPGDAIMEQIRAGVFRPVETEEPPDMAIKYFTTESTPAPLWVSTDGVIAVRVTPEHWAALGNPAPVLLSAQEAARYAYVNALDQTIVLD